MLMITLQVRAALCFLRSIEPYIIVKYLKNLLHISQSEAVNLGVDTISPYQDVLCFSYYLQVDASVVYLLRWRPFLSTSFRIPYSLIICALWKVSSDAGCLLWGNLFCWILYGWKVNCTSARHLLQFGYWYGRHLSWSGCDKGKVNPMHVKKAYGVV